MTEDTSGWIFVDKIPLLYEKKRVARQHQIETWLDLYQLTKELNIQKTEKPSEHLPLSYVV